MRAESGGVERNFLRVELWSFEGRKGCADDVESRVEGKIVRIFAGATVASSFGGINGVMFLDVKSVNKVSIFIYCLIEIIAVMRLSFKCMLCTTKRIFVK